MSTTKLYEFSKSEISFLKKVLPSCKLMAYQIQTFQNILSSLDNPFELPTVENNVKEGPPIPEPIMIQNHSQLDKTSDFFQSPGITKQIKEPIEEDPMPTPTYSKKLKEFNESKTQSIEAGDEESIFGVIDSRSV